MNFTSLGAHALLPLTPVALVGSYDSNHNANIMTAAWVGIINSQPPMLSVSIRHERLTYKNIVTSSAFTLSIPSQAQAIETDFAGIVSGIKTDKCTKLNLTPVMAEHIDAPYIQECPYILELALVATHDLGSHTCFFGEVLDIKIHSELLDSTGSVISDKIRPLTYSPLTKDYKGFSENLGRAFSIGKSF